jgi:hypothetical protein
LSRSVAGSTPRTPTIDRVGPRTPRPVWKNEPLDWRTVRALHHCGQPRRHERTEDLLGEPGANRARTRRRGPRLQDAADHLITAVRETSICARADLGKKYSQNLVFRIVRWP